MDIKQATSSYEEWFAKHTPIVKADLETKHKNMASNPFVFLRGTCYRWAQTWPATCPDLAKAPQVLAIGDLHIENFGTWRDCDGRLIWGVNDFDEVHTLPYTNDLVRLATSAKLACAGGRLDVSFEDACKALLSGYQKYMEEGGSPFVLAESHSKLRKMATGDLRDPVQFWEKLKTLNLAAKPVPVDALEALEKLMPEQGLPATIMRRQAGQGSLGRPRYVALSHWRGGYVAREAKALLPSCWIWASGNAEPENVYYQTLIDRAVRCRDPFVRVEGQWIVRRLAPDCSRIELSSLPQVRDEKCLLKAMGAETANIHLGTPEARKAILKDLNKRGKNWLYEAAKSMDKQVRSDWKGWRNAYEGK